MLTYLADFAGEICRNSLEDFVAHRHILMIRLAELRHEVLEHHILRHVLNSQFYRQFLGE